MFETVSKISQKINKCSVSGHEHKKVVAKWLHEKYTRNDIRKHVILYVTFGIYKYSQIYPHMIMKKKIGFMKITD